MECHLCKEQFKNKPEANQHMITVHNLSKADIKKWKIKRSTFSKTRDNSQPEELVEAIANYIDSHVTPL
jgi:EAL domain-containing protein (putative c-di-GMP-specific phosphodiesterase class I)